VSKNKRTKIVGVDGNEAMSWCIWKFQEERRKKKDGETSPVADKYKNNTKTWKFSGGR
jgi:hypothetical protein